MPDSPRMRALLGPFLLTVALLVHFHFTLQGWASPGLLGHGFRQAQTALTIDAMRQDGFRLDYATPVLGKPWSIPMEFPLYQWLAVKTGELTGWPTAQSGRAVSLAAFYLTLPALWLVLRLAGAGRGRACLLLLPVLATPVYLYYSRAVLIESLALAGSAWFLACALGHRRDGRVGWLLGAWLAGTMAALVKGTTWAVFLVPWALVLLAEAGRAEAGARTRKLVTTALRGLLVAAPPLVLGLAWVGLADRIKAENPLAAFLLSGNLAGFNFGGLAERLDLSFWREIFGQWCRTAMPWWALVASGLGLIWTPARWRWRALLALAGFLAGPLVFANLYRIHDYYHYATAVFPALAAGVVMLGLAAEPGWRRWCGGVGFAALLVGQGLTYRREYFPMQTEPFLGADALTMTVMQVTAPDDVIVVHGTDWSSEIPYYSKRRALMIPEGQLALAPEAVAKNIRLLHDEHVALVVFSGTSKDRPDLIAQRTRDFSLYPTPLFSVDDRAVVYAAEGDFLRMAEILRTDTHAAGVQVHEGGPVVPSTREVQPLGARYFAGALRDLRPTPVRGILPYGYVLLNDNGRRIFMAHVPTELYFEVPPGARSVVLAYRVFSGAFAKPGFSGVRFLVERRGPDGPAAVLLDDWIGLDSPESERGLHERVLTLPPGADGEIVFRTLAGPDGNAAFGWALLDRFEIR